MSCNALVVSHKYLHPVPSTFFSANQHGDAKAITAIDKGLVRIGTHTKPWARALGVGSIDFLFSSEWEVNVVDCLNGITAAWNQGMKDEDTAVALLMCILDEG